MAPTRSSPPLIPVLSTGALTALALGRRSTLPPGWLYFSGRGRIGRATFWRHGVLALLLIGLLGVALLQIAGMSSDSAQAWIDLALLWPVIAISIKRWHDIDRSGFFSLVNLIPAIGQLVALIANGFVRGSAGPNRYGDDPLAR